MKKVILSLAVIFSVAMVSCGGNKAAEQADSTPVEETVEAAEVVDTVNAGTDSAVVDTTVAVAETAAAE